MIAIEASDARLPESYDDLSKRLEGQGTVYVPHVVIRPEARMAVIRPPRLVVGLATPDALVHLEDWAADYLANDSETELRFHREDRAVVLRRSNKAVRHRLHALLYDNPVD